MYTQRLNATVTRRAYKAVITTSDWTVHCRA